MVDAAVPQTRSVSWSLPSLRLRHKLLLQVLVICAIAFAGSIPALFTLRATGDRLDRIIQRLHPAAEAVRLTRELQRIYALSEAYPLYLGDDRRWAEIDSELAEAKKKIFRQFDSILQGSAQLPDLAVDEGRFKRTLEFFDADVTETRDVSDGFRRYYRDREGLMKKERDFYVKYRDIFREKSAVDTELAVHRRHDEIARQIQSLHQSLTDIMSIQIFPLPDDVVRDLQRASHEIAVGNLDARAQDSEMTARLMAGFKTHQAVTDGIKRYENARYRLREVVALEGTRAEDGAAVADLLTESDDLLGSLDAVSGGLTIVGLPWERYLLLARFRLKILLQGELISQLDHAAGAMVEASRKAVDEDTQAAGALRREAVYIAAVAMICSLAAALVFLFFVLDRNLLRRLNEITHGMRELAGGGTVRVRGLDRSDELGEMSRALQRFQQAELERRSLQYQLTIANQQLRREVDDSTKVAMRIQASLFGGQLIPGPGLSASALLNRPRDQIGGDCYCFERFEDGYVVALIDCTGHGVPGAMMTIVVSLFLREVLHTECHDDPAEIMVRLAHRVQASLADHAMLASSDAGFDSAICYLDLRSRELRFAGGGIPLLLCDGDDVRMVKGDGFGIENAAAAGKARPHVHRIPIRPGMRFVLSSDGLVTQPDVSQGAGFGWTRFLQLLGETRTLPIDQQLERVWSVFQAFSGKTSQRDDVTVIGIAV